MKFEDRSQGETEGQELSLPRRRVETCHEYVQASASTLKQEEREFVVDSGASMYMVSKKDLNKAELETAKVSRSPPMVMTPTATC